MDKLPKEIFLHILSYLNFEIKLECLFVCKKWHKRIVRHSLYNEIEIKSQTSLDLMMSYFKKHRVYGSSVYKLTCMFSCDDNISMLQSLFPNIKEIKLHESIQSYKNVKLLKNSWKNLKQIKSTESFENGTCLIDLMLRSATFHNLTKIHITFDVDFSQTDKNRIPYLYKKTQILNSLKSAPNLSILSLDGLYLTVYDLELIHAFCHLNSLLLKSTTLLIDELPPNITPVSLSTLSIHFINQTIDQDILWHWLTYLISKYNQLESLQFEYHKFFSFDFINDKILHFLQNNLLYLKNYKILFYPIKKEILSNENLIKNLIVYQPFQDQFNLIKDTNKQHLVESIQLLDYLKNSMVDFNLLLSNLIHFQNITALEFHSNSQPIHLNCLTQFLKSLKNLTTLSIQSNQIYHSCCSDFVTKETFNIKNLYISKLKMNSLDDLKHISQFFNHLFKNTSKLENFNLNFNFPTLQEPLDDDDVCDYIDLNFILDLTPLTQLKSIQLNSDTNWYQLSNQYYLYDKKRVKFHKKFNISPRYFFITLNLSKQIYLNSVQILK